LLKPWQKTSSAWHAWHPLILIIIIIINDICNAQTSPRSKCAKSAIA